MRFLKRLLPLLIAAAVVLPSVEAKKKPDYRYKVPKLKYKKPNIKGHKVRHH